MLRIIVILILFYPALTVAVAKCPENGSYIDTYTALLKTLKEGYNNEVMPKASLGAHFNVSVNMTLGRIEDLNEEDDKFTVGAYFVQVWTDPRLTWDMSACGNISVVRLRASDVWTPDTTLYNGATDAVDSSNAETVIVMSNGAVMWWAQYQYTAHCAMDFLRYPFDVQKCFLSFGLWTYLSNDIRLHFTNLAQTPDALSKKADVHYHPYATETNEHPQWELVNKKGTGNIFALPAYENITFDVVVIEMLFRRKADFYRYVIIGPSVIMAVMIPIIFLLPPRATEKTLYGMGVLIAHLFLIFLLEDQIPFNHSSVPKLAKYHLLTMILACLSVGVSVFVIYLTEKGRYKRTVPAWVHKLFLSRRGVRWLLCVDSMRPVDRFYSSLATRNFEDYPDGEADSNDTAQELEDPVTSRDNKQLRSIQKSLRVILNKFSADEAYENVQREWEELAIIVDRICFILFYFVFVISSFAMMSGSTSA